MFLFLRQLTTRGRGIISKTVCSSSTSRRSVSTGGTSRNDKDTLHGWSSAMISRNVRFAPHCLYRKDMAYFPSAPMHAGSSCCMQQTDCTVQLRSLLAGSKDNDVRHACTLPAGNGKKQDEQGDCTCHSCQTPQPLRVTSTASAATDGQRLFEGLFSSEVPGFEVSSNAADCHPPPMAL